MIWNIIPIYLIWSLRLFETKQCRIAHTSADHTLLRYVLELFKKVYPRRMRIRLIGVKFTGLVEGCHQMNLFEDTEELISCIKRWIKLKIDLVPPV
ncbi:DinB/UmuC family translesion DNA polymerase [Chryseobacterium salivictor]